jgi:excisionase family DNA binding protein
MPHDGPDRLPDWVSASQPDKARVVALSDSQDQPLLKLAEVANLLRISTKTVRRMVQAGSLPALRVGRALRFEREQISMFLNSLVIRRE